MSRYPHRTFAEKQKRVQIQNWLEGKFLKQKLDSFSREKLCIDRELRRISLARSSLLESLDRFNTVPNAAQKRLSLPCLLDGPRKDHNARPISKLRRHTVTPTKTGLATLERRLQLKPESLGERSISRCKEPIIPQCNAGTQCVQRSRSTLRVARLSRSEDAHEIRVASPVTASLILSGQVDKKRDNNERSLFSWQGNFEKAKTGTPLHLPKIPDSTTKLDVKPAGRENPRDGMLATNLKSKFRQIGSVVMATAILRTAHERDKNKNGK